MSPKDFPVSFYESLAALSRGTIDPAQLAELEALLATNPEARQAYYDYLDVEQGLAEIAAPQQTPSRPAAPAPVPRSRPRWFMMAAMIAASIVATLAVEWSLLGLPRLTPPVNQQTIAVAPAARQFVATLVRSTDCEWADEKSPFFEGKRLLSSDLQLTRGVAEFRFDTGVRLILEGPVKMTIESARSAMLEHGKVVLHGNELAAEFALKTPKGTLYDIGTEYGAQVDENANVELHVFEGQVRVEPMSPTAQQQLVSAGDARRIDGANFESVPLRPEQFQREVPGRSDVVRLSRDGLLAYEGFESNEQTGSEKAWQFGGTGWDGGWRHEINRPLLSRGIHEDRLSLEFDPALRPDRRGALHLLPQRRTACRVLKQPIRMNSDALYYVSFFMMKQGSLHPSETQYGSLSLRTSIGPWQGKRLLFGMTSSRLPLLSHSEQNIRSAEPLELGQSYFYVAKIVAGAQAPDQILMKVFSKETPIPDQEPLNWTCMSESAFDDTIYDHVAMYVEGTDYLFDEIRIASTWQAAVNFQWPAAPAPKSSP